MRFDAIVIGSGQGGNPLAHRLADLGRTVALIERKHLGGTCINTGCTPTKAMVASAQVAHYARNAARWGIRASSITADMKAIVARKNEVVQSFRSGQERRVAERKTLQLFHGQAQFRAAHELEVAGQVLESEQIFIDTGCRPSLPSMAGLDKAPYLTNETILELQELPECLLVLGGGYIGLEFGQIFHRFGSRVIVVNRGPEILPREDPEVASELKKALEAEGLEFRLNRQTKQVDTDGTRVTLRIEGSQGQETVSGSHLLVATGRVPNVEDLHLEKGGVRTNEKGFIQVNERLETNVPGIWALGDVNGGPAFTHISYNDFQIIYGNLVEGKSLSTRDRIVPYSVFTDPQLGGVGMTEREAKAKGYRLKIGNIPTANVARAIERGETAGLMKIVVNASDDRILGASILSADGGELVQILHAIMLANQPYTVLKGAIYIHPTMAEGFFGLMESVSPVN